MSKRIYIAGPMTGIPNNNFPAFHAEASRLRSLGYDVVNPADVKLPDGADTWSHFMRADLALLMTCDAVSLLAGWERSPGASLEHHNARALGFDISLAPCAVVALNHKPDWSAA